MAPLVVGLGAGERVDPVVLGMAAVALDPMPFDAVRRGGLDQLLPKLGILDRLACRTCASRFAATCGSSG